MKQRLFSRNFSLLIAGQSISLCKLHFGFCIFHVHIGKTGSAAIYAGVLAVATIPTIILSPLGEYWLTEQIGGTLWYSWTSHLPLSLRCARC